MSTGSSYDKWPSIRVDAAADAAWEGWRSINEAILRKLLQGAKTVAVECYPGTFTVKIAEQLKNALAPIVLIQTEDCFRNSADIVALTARDLTDDPVFGRMNGWQIDDFFDLKALSHRQQEISKAEGRVLIVGIGTQLFCPRPDVLIFADLPRWEIQQRQRRGEMGNLGLANAGERPALKYKRAYFLDWRVADRVKKQLLRRADFLLDTTEHERPKLVTGEAFRKALRHVVTRPFRVVPFFDPGPWGGQWMRNVCGLDEKAPNYAWCFDCVPEENSLLLDFGSVRVEVPAIDLVFEHPRELLGDAVHGRFGTEFPIRFDFLDTMEGGNLSLQVHPLTEYIQDKFGMAYTQDESYYMLDAAPDACVYLGVKDNVDRRAMSQALWDAQERGVPFPADSFINRWPAKKHDHFLIPAGTIHCSGRNSMVLEISATPYIFTFKLWDWGRLGLDGRPRPIHLQHGLANIQWDRDTEWVRKHLLKCVERIGGGNGWFEERTGLHEREFIETRRHWFREAAMHRTNGSVHVLNLVEGDSAVVESPNGLFDDFTVHYAETFIVPAAVGEYTVRPSAANSGKRLGTLRASVRSSA